MCLCVGTCKFKCHSFVWVKIMFFFFSIYFSEDLRFTSVILNSAGPWPLLWWVGKKIRSFVRKQTTAPVYSVAWLQCILSCFFKYLKFFIRVPCFFSNLSSLPLIIKVLLLQSLFSFRQYALQTSALGILSWYIPHFLNPSHDFFNFVFGKIHVLDCLGCLTK